MDCFIYVDVYFLLNFWMNALSLFLVCRVVKSRNVFRCLLAAALGAVFGVCSMLLYLKERTGVILPCFCIGGLIGMTVISFGIHNFLWNMFLVFLSGVMLAGMYLFLLSASANFLGMDYAVVFVSVTSILFIVYLERRCRIRWKEEHMKVRTVLEFQDRKVVATALVDTGNKLHDPFFHKPVILASELLIKDMLLLCEERYPEKIHYIPFHSVGKEQGMLKGMTLDRVSIHWQEKKMLFSEVIVAATKESLYRGRPYQVIFHCDLLQEW